MKRLLISGLVALTTGTTLFAQSKLDTYIRDGLSNNESIRQQGFQLEKSMYALNEAKTLFMPDVSFSTTYTKAGGGRTIEFPSGDLLNGAYAALNKLTATNAFPQLKNQTILLNPDNFYDAKFRTSMPLLNAELKYNLRIKSQQADLQKEEVLLYKRELVKDIKLAYYQYAKAENAVNIYKSALKLVIENKRINTALFNNQKVNRTAVIRSENEVTKINAKLVGANYDVKSARAYFNFLLNKPLTDTVLVDSLSAPPVSQINAGFSVSNREELTKLKIAQGINENVSGLAGSYIIPKINTFIDLGSQAYQWKVNSNSAYYLFGVSLQWDLFASGRNTFKKKQAIAEQQSLQAENTYVENRLQTQLNVARNAYLNEVAQYEAAQAQLRTTREYYKDELRLYKEGQALYIELLDAQTQLVEARLEANNALFDTWSRYADVERANAGFVLN